jgi:tRNA(Ile)-lysidine synthetase-like protein
MPRMDALAMPRMDVLARVRATIAGYNLLAHGATAVVAVSGGPDSLCLLHTLLVLRPELGLSLHVAHLNHRLRPEAEADAAYVAQLSADWQLPCTVGVADVRALAREEHHSVEEAARLARYRFLADVACSVHAQAVAVGHNADDQVETVLMHCLRGAGLAGLRGMLRRAAWPERASDECPPLDLVRPLLDVPRSAVEAYVSEHGLQPRLDRSNQEMTYFRNRIRGELLPYLETFNPKVRRLLHRSADLLADDYDYLQHSLDQAWPHLVLLETSAAVTLRREVFRELPRSLQRGALRRAAMGLRPDLRDFGWQHVERTRRAATLSPTGTRITLPAGLLLEVGYEELVLRPSGKPRPEPAIPLLADGEHPVPVPGAIHLAPGGWLIEASLSEGPAPMVRRKLELCLDAEQVGESLALRARRPGDRFQPRGLGGHSKSIKDYMIDARIPRRVRDRVPLLVSERGILWVVGWRPSEVASPGPETRRLLCLRLVPPVPADDAEARAE